MVKHASYLESPGCTFEMSVPRSVRSSPKEKIVSVFTKKYYPIREMPLITRPDTYVLKLLIISGRLIEAVLMTFLVTWPE